MVRCVSVLCCELCGVSFADRRALVRVRDRECVRSTRVVCLVLNDDHIFGKAFSVCGVFVANMCRDLVRYGFRVGRAIEQ